MFGIGWLEIVVIFVLVLLVFGPKRLPEIGAALGKAMQMFRQATQEVRESLSEIQSEFRSEINDVEQTGRDLKRMLIEEPENLVREGGKEDKKKEKETEVEDAEIEEDTSEQPPGDSSSTGEDDSTHPPLAG